MVCAHARACLAQAELMTEACASAVSVLEVSSTFSTVSSCSLPSKQARMDDRMSIDDDLYLA